MPAATTTMSSINSLLNHEPASEPRRPSRSSVSQEHFTAKTTTYEAADALTALATLGSGQQYVPAPARELPSPTTFAHAPRRTSSFGSHIAPVEPSPPIDQPQAHSPTLEQYHHGSKSPEEQRRQSLLSRTCSSPPILAPIQSLSSALHERIHEEPQPASSYGKDVSQVVSPPSRSSDGGHGRDSTQNREPAYVRDEPTTAQIREPDSINSTPHPVSLPSQEPAAQETKRPEPIVKIEPAATPQHEPNRDVSPSTIPGQSERQPSVATDDLDPETRKAIDALKQNDLGLRTKRTASVSESIASPTDSKPAPAPSKKRPAPSTIKKKGTAALKKPSSKKRKLDGDADPNARSVTPTSRPSKPASSRPGKKGSQAGTPAAESSPAPDNSSQAHASDDEAESSDDNALYCICRKPDNHKWMIGCDGGCDDWFHGSCVDMVQSDEDLVDKFICPNCESAGKGETTWKPMCRRDGCRKPARLTKGSESKYCSDDCGRLFMQENLARTAGAKMSKKSRKKGSKDGEDQLSDDEEEPTPLGGVLRAKDLKALTMVSKDIEAFKRLGSGVLSPPQTASPTKPDFDGTNGTSDSDENLPFTTSELGHLKALRSEMSVLKDKLEVLKDREKFVSMAREQATRYAEKEKIKPKEFCGYDSRLSWSDTEFLRWRKGKHGRAAFKFSTLSPTPEQVSSLDADGDVQMNGINGAEHEKEHVCLKKRCPKHPQWQKLNLQDARFEEVEVVEAIKECEKEERSVRERARRRGAKDAMEAELVGGEKKDEKNREGWVEMVGA